MYIFTHKKQPQYEIALKNRRKWNTFSFIDKKNNWYIHLRCSSCFLISYPYISYLRYDDGIASKSILCLCCCFNNASYAIILVSIDSICNFNDYVNIYLFALFLTILQKCTKLFSKSIIFLYQPIFLIK